MNKNLILISTLFLIFLYGCSRNENLVNPEIKSNSGNIVLKIDRTNAPVNVASVTALLTRENFEPITGTLNLLSDTSAGITFTSIPIGTWHLKIDALNNNNQVIYSGETDVEVLDNILTQVNLTLQPTSTGVGGILINVTWGTGNNSVFHLTDYVNNPIFNSFGNFWNEFGVRHPVVYKESYSLYHMLFSGVGNNGSYHIGHAVSNNGINWMQFIFEPVLSPGIGISWDSHAVIPGAVINDSGHYKLYYCGFASPTSQWHIGLATSVNGVDWTKKLDPVLMATSNSEFQIAPSSVVKHNNLYYMYYYSRSNELSYSIKLAISNDGINWNRYSTSPIIIANNSGWEFGGIYSASVIKDGNSFKMIYMTKSSKYFGYAESVDGINWQKQITPIFSFTGTTNNWANNYIMYPNFVKDDNQYRVYYAGMGLNSLTSQIGVALK